MKSLVLLIIVAIFLVCFTLALTVSFITARLYYKRNALHGKKHYFRLPADQYRPERSNILDIPRPGSIDNDSALSGFVKK